MKPFRSSGDAAVIHLPGVDKDPGVSRISAVRPADASSMPAVKAVQNILRRPGLLRVAVQPLINLGRADVAGYECLALCPAEWGVGPDQLFCAAAELGVSAAVQRLVVEQVIDLRENAPRNTFITMNLEPRHLLDPSLVAPLQAATDLSRIVIEVTERDWPSDTSSMIETLDHLRAKGALVALDDAGAGHSDLARLMALRPDLVKLDHHLSADIDTNPRTRSMVSLMGDLCGRLDAWLLLEGIERSEQLRSAAQLGVPLAQGYLLGRPEWPWPTPHLPLVNRAILREASMQENIVSVLEPPADPQEIGTPSGPAQMTMAPETRLEDALRRALNRPMESRFQPVTVTDGRGRVLGEVSIDRLTLAVLDRAGQLSRSST